MLESSERKDLLVAAKRYVQFLNDASSWDRAMIAKQVNDLCAPKCVKILNGQVVFKRREGYVDQLLEAKEAVGKYSLETLEILTSFNDRLAVARHLVNTEKAGIQIVFVILRYDSDFRITEINEVYNKKE